MRDDSDELTLLEIAQIAEERKHELQQFVIALLKALWCPANDGGPTDADLGGEVDHGA